MLLPIKDVGKIYKCSFKRYRDRIFFSGGPSSSKLERINKQQYTSSGPTLHH